MNNKRVLCKNIISNQCCLYNNTCLYAHSLKEQNVIPIRKYLYDIIRSDVDLSNINLLKSPELLKELTILSKVCLSCQRNECAGGYNCRYGAINNNCRVCYDDFYYGQCKRSYCNAVHLTNRGLVPLMGMKQVLPEVSSSVVRLNILNNSNTCKTNTIWDQLPKSIYDKPLIINNNNNFTSLDCLNYDINGSHYEGIKLTDEYLKKRYSSSQDVTSSEDENETSEFIEYLNSVNNHSDSESSDSESEYSSIFMR